MVARAKKESQARNHMAALGYVAAAWAALEFVINDAIWQLANVPQDAGACITAQIVPIGGRTRAYTALADLRGVSGDARLKKSINAYMKDVEGLGRQRNRAVHDPWGINEATGDVQRLEITADKALTMEFKPVALQELNDLYAKIVAAATEFIALHSHVMAVVRPLPRKHYEQSVAIRLVRAHSDQTNARKAPRRPRKSSRV